MTVDLLPLVKGGAERAALSMSGPDSNWSPILMYEDPTGAVNVAGMPGMTPERVEALLVQAEAVQAALVLPTVFSEITKEGVDQNERVLVTLVTKDHTHCEAARVIRSGTDPPTLGPWDRVADDSEVGAGVFVDALRTAIR